MSDITYVRTYEGFLYVATVMDLFSRRIVGWSMDKSMDKHLVTKTLLMAVGQRQPKPKVMVHSSQYGSADYSTFIKEHNLVPSMSQQETVMIMRLLRAFLLPLKNE
ncbi:DDE-type integrase/transposase/recombinase [Pseudoalteromonas sp. MMG012]|uniref:DDE-type integrase/transposase/recombinase n=1 Tax=Pseudoalteromonas sp. MMG012 TaxID=2822686 RepID=UPI001B3A3611|nr:DDE-type integrase/transposase/recombinase [Pseudoalteromonas sp. MMG012]MBQ4853015.1 DDE-type integrase/transposase/recombinase [Pseudoalteromonas sp. MMG012]